MDPDTSDEDQNVGREYTCLPKDIDPESRLKPQIDSIFSEIEKSLPTIDFDLSDLSSDSEEPVVLHHSLLKSAELDLDDEKELDTSLSGESAPDIFRAPGCSFHTAGFDKNLGSGCPALAFDNDLAALLSACDDADEEVTSWKDLEKIAQQDKVKQGQKEEMDPEGLTRNEDNKFREQVEKDATYMNDKGFADGEITLSVAEAEDLMVAQIKENIRAGNHLPFGGRTVSSQFLLSSCSVRSTGSATEDFASEEACNKEEIEEMSAKHQRHREERKSQHKQAREQQRHCSKELAMKYSTKTPLLSFDLLNNINFENLTLSNRGENERQKSPAADHLDSLSEASDTCRHPENNSKDHSDSDTLTLIQKLTKCALQQAGKPVDLSAFDPQTGAVMTSSAAQSTATPLGSMAMLSSPLLSAKQCGATKLLGINSETGECVESTIPHAVEKPPSSIKKRNAIQEGRKSSDTGLTMSQSKNIRNDKRWCEPKTVYIDLRGFEQHQKEEKQCMASVTRVLGLEHRSKQEVSSDSEEEEVWMQRRQEIKKKLLSRGTSTSVSSSCHRQDKTAASSGNGKQSKQKHNSEIRNKSAPTGVTSYTLPDSTKTLPSTTTVSTTSTEQSSSSVDVMTISWGGPVTCGSVWVSTEGRAQQKVEADTSKDNPASNGADICNRQKMEQNRQVPGEEEPGHMLSSQVQEPAVSTAISCAVTATSTSFGSKGASVSKKANSCAASSTEEAVISCTNFVESAVVKEEQEKQRETDRREHEKRERERSARLRMGRHLESLCPTACVSETQLCAENTPVLFDVNVSYEPCIPVLPVSLDGVESMLLITVALSSNGEIAAFSSHANKNMDKKNHLCKSYLSLVCWLLSLVYPNFECLKKHLQHPQSSPEYPDIFPPFHVIGMQQLWVNESFCLAVVVCPSPIYCLQKGDKRELSHLRKTKKGESTSKFYKFVDTFLSRNSLGSVRCWKQYMSSPASSSVRDKYDSEEDGSPLTFSTPGSSIFNKPLSSFMQIHEDVSAIDKIFNKDVGFFWQTVDSRESYYEHGLGFMTGESEQQNTVIIIHGQALFLPKLVYALLERVTLSCCDICGLRVLYPEERVTCSLPSIFDTKVQRFPGVSPVLAVAIRGPNARSKVARIVGPLDHRIAAQTDPECLSAVFGNSTSRLGIYHLRSLDNIPSDLVRWFGGRVAKGASMDVGLPYRPKDGLLTGKSNNSSPSQPTSKKKKRRRLCADDPDEYLVEEAPSRPPAALTGTTRSHMIFVISPLVPASALGLLIQTMQQMAGFQPRGIRRFCLSVRRATSIGLPSECHCYFCPGINLEFAALDSSIQQQNSSLPCTMILLERENASHHIAALCEMLAAELASKASLRKTEEWAENAVQTEHLFHVVDYTDIHLATLGGQFSKCPEFDPHGSSLHCPEHLYSNSELEQVVVLLLVGRELLKDWGSFLRSLQSQTSVSHVDQAEWCDYELLGVKWLPCLSPFLAREVTPFELGDKDWKSSVQYLSTAPAVVLALRGVNAFCKLEHFLNMEQTVPSKLPAEVAILGPCTSKKVPHPTKLMSRTADEAYTLLRLFFGSSELFPDSDCRSLLKYLPESHHYFTSAAWNGPRNVAGSKPKPIFTSVDSQGLKQESILDQLLSGPSLITTFLLVKPGVAAKHLAKVMRKVVHENFTIVGMRQEIMDMACAHRFLALDSQSCATELQEHLEYLTSAPSIFLCLRRENAVKKLIDLIGPEDPHLARRLNQFYWRGVFGRDVVHNGLYASPSYLEAVWDQKLFFPDGLCCCSTHELAAEQISCPAVDTDIDLNFAKHRQVLHNASSKHDRDPQIAMVHSLLMQTTCLVLPPKLLAMKSEAKDAPFVHILDCLLGRGFELVGARMVWMNKTQAQQFLHVMHAGNFQAVTDLTSGPCLVLALDRDNAVLAFDITLGGSGDPGSVLSVYGKDVFRPTDLEQANHLLALFFRQLMSGSHLEICDVQEAS